MNKNVIAKNLEQFNSWVKEENDVLVGEQKENRIEWSEVSSMEDWNSETGIYIKNDFAVSLRKAVAEGKQIYFWKIKEQHPTNESKDVYDWRKLNNVHLNYAFEKDISLYMVREKLGV